jgi:hypothetical protein
MCKSNAIGGQRGAEGLPLKTYVWMNHRLHVLEYNKALLYKDTWRIIEQI